MTFIKNCSDGNSHDISSPWLLIDLLSQLLVFFNYSPLLWCRRFLCSMYLCAISTNVRCSRFYDTVYSCTISTNYHCHLFILSTPIYLFILYCTILYTTLLIRIVLNPLFQNILHLHFVYTPWYNWKIAELALNNNHSLNLY